MIAFSVACGYVIKGYFWYNIYAVRKKIYRMIHEQVEFPLKQIFRLMVNHFFKNIAIFSNILQLIISNTTGCVFQGHLFLGH